VPNILTVPAVALSAHRALHAEGYELFLEVAAAYWVNSIGRRNTLSRRLRWPIENGVRHDLGGRHCCHQVDRPWQDAMSGDGSGPPLRGMASEDAALRQCAAGYRTRWFRRQAACHQRCLDDRRAALRGYCRLRNGRACDPTCAGAGVREIARQMGGQRRRSRGVATQCRDAQRGLDYRATTAQWHADGPLGAQSLRSWRSTRRCERMCRID